MSLPACQERILSGMEKALKACEPRLASRFAIFARLTRDEELPRTEQLMPPSWLQRVLASIGQAWRFLFPRSRSRGIAAMRAPGRAAGLRAAVVLPVLLIVMASVTVVTAVAGTHPCSSAPRRPAVTQTRWATCAAGAVVVQGPHSTGRNPATGHKSSQS
jgi:hypothetical protein